MNLRGHVNSLLQLQRGQELHQQRLTVAVPAGVEHGDRFSFSVSLPRGPRTRVDVRVILS